jgi:hypothetical protein
MSKEKSKALHKKGGYTDEKGIYHLSPIEQRAKAKTLFRKRTSHEISIEKHAQKIDPLYEMADTPSRTKGYKYTQEHK